MSYLKSPSLAIVENPSFEYDVVGCNNNYRQCLKSTAKVCKRKCSKSLKKKLKKYKIKNGDEDPNVLDVSKSLSTSLIIKSPDSQNIPESFSALHTADYIQPRNYLFKKMGKRKKCRILTESNRKIVEDQINQDILHHPIHIHSEETHNNAFKVLMDSRNKSIGTNSPGKELPKNHVDCSRELIEKKEIKAKRILSLQKMCEAKGSLKKQELEEHREKQINKKMLKRAERFKVSLEQDNSETKCNSKHIFSVKESSSPKDYVNDVLDDNTCKIDVRKTLQLCNIFKTVDEELITKKEKINKVSIEDEEFLNKLSPSIRKKESMMSYFKKVPKGIEEDDIVMPADNIQNIIKVKFIPKHKRKVVKNKSVADIINCNGNLNSETVSEPPKENKSNHIKVLSESEVKKSVKHQELEVNTDSRPKRNSKRPAKYVDNVEIVSSDDDLKIFTPKKKRNLKADNDKELEEKRPETTNFIDGCKIFQERSKVKCKILSVHKKNKKETARPTQMSKSQETSKIIIKGGGNQVKLAPIFMSKQSLNINSAQKEAKQKFLQSGIPEKLKKGTSKQNKTQISDTFHIVVHIQQVNKEEKIYNSTNTFKVIEFNTEEICNNYTNGSYKNLLKLNVNRTSQASFSNYNKNELLEYIKKSYEKFPVYRTYHLLKGKSKGEFKDFHYPELDNSVEIINGISSNDSDFIEKLCWVDKYKPNSTKQIIGNFAAIDELKKWLQTWTENLIKSGSQPDKSDGSDFSDFVDSDTDSRDTIRNSNNVLIISGDVGSGKTSCVYAVAAELAIKVIEVNASSKRTGKIMLQDLQEATRSHKVDRGKNSDCSQNVQDVFRKKETHKRPGRPKKVKQGGIKSSNSFSQKSDPSETPLSQDNVRTDMSLILIDDADIVFDQDDGFCSAVSQLIQSSKRPVILVTSSLSCPHLQKFVQYGKIVTLHRFLPRMLGVWLDVMCIADTGTCCPGLGKTLLDFFKGDIRKTINYLQFYMASYMHNPKKESSVSLEGGSQGLDVKLSVDDEVSNMSWTDHECCLDNNEILPETILDTQKKSINQHMNTILHNGPHLLNVWWSLPKLLFSANPRKKEKQGKGASTEELLLLSNMLDMVSVADYLSPKMSNERNSIASTLWSSKETASVDETESYQYYDRCDEVREDIVSDFVSRGLTYTQKEMNCKTSLNISIPGYGMARERDKVAGRHHTLTSYLNPGVILDKKALALDYWSACRTICRLEMNKTDVNIKRNNRFCHYLKSLNVLCKNDYFDALSKSLSCSSGDTGKL